MSDASTKKALVIGASGFLGRHLVRELCGQGYPVRILTRPTSDIRPLEGLAFERVTGDVMDTESLRRAMDGCDYVFHSAVNTAAWLADSGPLYETNVVGVMNAVNAARQAGVARFVLTSSIGTIGRAPAGGVADEQCVLTDREHLAPYVRTRELGENIVLAAFRETGFPGIACCVANTYGPLDTQPTPHGDFIRQVAKGRVPVYLDVASECVGVADAARALILAAEKGRPGERYIVSERYIRQRELFTLAAEHAGVKPPRFAFPVSLLYGLTAPVEAVCRLLNIDTRLTLKSVRLLTQTWPMSHQKAVDELGWQPEPLDVSIRQAVDDYLRR